jgi:uncharacterized protein YaaN involved in tellurite resistance
MAPAEQELVPTNALQVREELALADPQTIHVDPQGDPELQEQAERYAQMLVTFNPDDFKARQEHTGAVEQMGSRLQRESAHRSAMLQGPIRNLSKRGEDGGEVANSLIDLKLQVEELDPARIDLEPGWMTRWLGWLPVVGHPLKHYFSMYESAQTVIDAIVRSLENGRDQLGRDNLTLADDQTAMRALTLRLEKSIKLGRLIDHSLEYKLDRDIPSDDARYQFVQEELLFPLRQRIQDLQQQLAVNQQGVLAIEIIIRNNKELVRGVNRAIAVTVSALQVAVTVAMALADQKIVLDKINALSATTSDLISGTAARLRTQGVEIHQQAAQTQLDMEALKSAFSDIQAAMEDISRFRQEALPQMATTILEMDRMTAEAEGTIQKLESGNQARPTMAIEIE